MSLTLYSCIQLWMVSLLLLNKTISQPTASDSCVLYNSTNSVCTRCLPGLYLQYYFCIPCNPLCTCSSNLNFCQACMNVTVGTRSLMSYRQGNICVLCNQTIPYCMQCRSFIDVNNNNETACVSCGYGRYLTQGKCSQQICTSNCQICKNNLQCDVCAPGYALQIQTFTCTTNFCTANCYQCNNNSTCKVCINGYYQSNGACLACISNCAVCKNQLSCIVCLPSYIPSNGTCFSTGISNCVQYTGGVQSPTCLVCEPGFYNAGGSCTQCSGCLLCTQSFLCQTPCFPGYTQFNYACIQYQQYFLYSLLFIFQLALLAMF